MLEAQLWVIYKRDPGTDMFFAKVLPSCGRILYFQENGAASNAPPERKCIKMNNRSELNRNLAQMLKGGVIMDVTTPEQAKIAEEAGACAVMALERIPAMWSRR